MSGLGDKCHFGCKVTFLGHLKSGEVRKPAQSTIEKLIYFSKPMS